MAARQMQYAKLMQMVESTKNKDRYFDVTKL